MTVPLAVNSALVAPVPGKPSRLVATVAEITTDAVEPFASAICEATVRFQMRS